MNGEKKQRGQTILLSCACKHEFQDKKYGKQVRVFNVAKENQARCSVCGSRRPI